MIKTENLTFLTDQYNQYFVITDEVERIVEDSGVREGIVTVISRHTTTGITTNEYLECLESDIQEFLGRLVPEDHPYAHARMLADYGSTAGNPTGHLKSLVMGNHIHFLIHEGKVDRGGAQDVYFCEFDGPASRTIMVQVQGE